MANLQETFGESPSSPFQKLPLSSSHYYILSPLPPLLDKKFGFPQRSHFSETSFPLYEGFENEIKGNLKVFLYLEKK